MSLWYTIVSRYESACKQPSSNSTCCHLRRMCVEHCITSHKCAAHLAGKWSDRSSSWHFRFCKMFWTKELVSGRILIFFAAAVCWVWYFLRACLRILAKSRYIKCQPNGKRSETLLMYPNTYLPTGSCARQQEEVLQFRLAGKWCDSIVPSSWHFVDFVEWFVGRNSLEREFSPFWRQLFVAYIFVCVGLIAQPFTL